MDDILFELRTELQTEYNRCLELHKDPTGSPDLFGVRRDQLSDYYGWRAEALGFAIDRMDRRLR